MSIRFLKPLFIVLILYSCSDDVKDSHTFTLTKTKEITLEQSEPLYGKLQEHFKISDSGKYLAFHDVIQEKIFVFDSTGTWISMLGENNKGPEGIVRIGGYDFLNDSTVLIYDSAQKMLKKFFVEGQFLSSKSYLEEAPFGAIPYEFHVYKDIIIHSIIESGFVLNPENSALYAKVKQSGEIMNLFGVHDDFVRIDNNYAFKNTISIDEVNDKLYTTLKTSPYIQVYDLINDTLINKIGVKTKSHSIPERPISRNISLTESKKRAAGTSTNLKIYTSNKYIVVHRQILTEEWFKTAYPEKKKNFILLYDKVNYSFIQEIKINNPLGTVSNNTLYLLEDLNPDSFTVGVYEVKAR